ncbi:phosphatase [Taibaiella soli]|uniref:Phosphatase n=1 Tax=Taibaiella soli TaxID=1649169 RepID=A0A2W2B3S5_9BACT|nr:phosphatase [Taibaiella soli]
MITYVKYGDIFKISGVTSYAHGCNCQGAMGKGIALQFKERYPNMYLEYKKRCKEGKFILGDVFEYNQENVNIFNLATQKSWRTSADIAAIEKSFETMLHLATEQEINKIALPKIGAGLGGLNWVNVKTIIELVASNYPKINLVIVENFKE